MKVIRVWLPKNILLFLIPENDTQVAVPINKISSIELFFFKNRSQVETGIIISSHDLEHKYAKF